MAGRITITLLREVLRYDPLTGYLYWRKRGPHLFSSPGRAKFFNSRHAGKRALVASDGNGYLCGNILGTKLKAHRVAWAIKTGEWPKVTDHINGIRTDNRWENLRSVTDQINMKNQKMRIDNTSGVVGVVWSKQIKRWLARITVEKKVHNIGCFVDFDAAVVARKEAERLYGFHENHGRCADG